MKKLLFTFLSLSSIAFAQEKGKARMMIYPGCEKFENKGVQKLADCFSKDFNKQLLLEVEQVLKNNGLTINEINVDKYGMDMEIFDCLIEKANELSNNIYFGMRND